MGELLLLIKLSLTKVQVEIMMVTVTVTGGVIVTVTVTMEVEVDVDLMVESALSVGNLDILLGSVQVKGQEGAAGMVAGMIGLVVAVVVGLAVMVLIETEIDLVGATGTLVVVEVLELIGIIVTVLDLMNAVQPEVFVPDRVTASHCGMQHIL